jgi:hypothetical protein
MLLSKAEVPEARQRAELLSCAPKCALKVLKSCAAMRRSCCVRRTQGGETADSSPKSEGADKLRNAKKAKNESLI